MSLQCPYVEVHVSAMQSQLQRERDDDERSDRGKRRSIRHLYDSTQHSLRPMKKPINIPRHLTYSEKTTTNTFFISNFGLLQERLLLLNVLHVLKYMTVTLNKYGRIIMTIKRTANIQRSDYPSYKSTYHPSVGLWSSILISFKKIRKHIKISIGFNLEANKSKICIMKIKEKKEIHVLPTRDRVSASGLILGQSYISNEY